VVVWKGRGVGGHKILGGGKAGTDHIRGNPHGEGVSILTNFAAMDTGMRKALDKKEGVR